ncbi:MAG TPA: hypothetical protein DCS97_13825 [Planctomycetes bacterium]|nr:hypothetical protein [Planctomycetota bacterium]
MHWLTGLFLIAIVTGAEPDVVPIDITLEITGYRIAGSEALVVVRATNQEPQPISYWSERTEHPFMRLSWQENDAWVDQQIRWCGFGSREQVLAVGEQREFTWCVGRCRKDAATGSVTWSWIPTAWPIRMRMRFHRPASPDWWDAMSAESEIDETLRPVMLQAVAVQGVPDVPTRPTDHVQATTSASRVAR